MLIGSRLLLGIRRCDRFGTSGLALDPTDPGSIVTSDGTVIQWWARTRGSGGGGSGPVTAGAARGDEGMQTAVGDGEAARPRWHPVQRAALRGANDRVK